MVSLRGLREHGPGVAMAAICHLNTSSWNPAYPAFEILHTKPGGAPLYKQKSDDDIRDANTTGPTDMWAMIRGCEVRLS
ncbi:hypothetical protein EJB05_13606, partial [Eragrostis curvula]